MGVVIPIAGTVVPMLVSMLVSTIVPMLVCVNSLEPPVAAIAAGESENRYYHDNRRGGFGCVHLRASLEKLVPLEQDHGTHRRHSDIGRETA
jgi:hypothetical protein